MCVCKGYLPTHVFVHLVNRLQTGLFLVFVHFIDFFCTRSHFWAGLKSQHSVMTATEG